METAGEPVLLLEQPEQRQSQPAAVVDLLDIGGTAAPEHQDSAAPTAAGAIERPEHMSLETRREGAGDSQLSSKSAAAVSALSSLSEEALREAYIRISRAAAALRQELYEQQQQLLVHVRHRRALDAELADLKSRACTKATAAATEPGGGAAGEGPAEEEDQVPSFLREDPLVALPAMLGGFIGRYKQPAQQLGASLRTGLLVLQQELKQLQQHQRQAEAERRAALRAKALLRQQECLELREIERLKRQHLQQQKQLHQQQQGCAAVVPCQSRSQQRQRTRGTFIARLQRLFSDSRPQEQSPLSSGAPPARSGCAGQDGHQQQHQHHQKQQHLSVDAPEAQIFRICSDVEGEGDGGHSSISSNTASEPLVASQSVSVSCPSQGRARIVRSPSCGGETVGGAPVAVTPSPVLSPQCGGEDCIIVAAEISVGKYSVPLRLAATESCNEAAEAWVDRHWGLLQRHWRESCPSATFLERKRAIMALETFLRTVEETAEELPVKATQEWSLILNAVSSSSPSSN